MLGATIILVVLSNVLGKVGKPRTGKQHKETAERSALPSRRSAVILQPPQQHHKEENQ